MVLRTISTVITVLGYVLFMGSLVAIMSQWLATTIINFDRGLAPIAMRGHVVVLGWNNRTPEIVRELLLARGRLRSFLERNKIRVIRIVVVSDGDVAERRRELRAFLGPHFRNRSIFMRAGSETSLADLARFDLARAGAIIVPGDEFRHGRLESSDTHVVKTLLSLRAILESTSRSEWPQVVAEVSDPRKERAAQRAFGKHLAILPGDAMIARLLAQSIRDPELVGIMMQMLSHAREHTACLRTFPELAGHPASELDRRFDQAMVIGVERVEAGRPVTRLNPGADFTLPPNDRLVLMAQSPEHLELNDPEVETKPIDRVDPPVAGPEKRRVLVLGWSTKIGSMLEQLDRITSIEADLTIVSRVPIAKREASLEEYEWDHTRIRIEHFERDYTVSGVLEKIDPSRFDRILLMAGTGMPTSAGADARTIVAYQLVNSILDERLSTSVDGPTVVIELVDPDSDRLFANSDDIILFVPRVLGHLEAQLALLGEVGSTFSELFERERLTLRRPEDYGLSGRCSQRDIAAAAAARGELVIGMFDLDEHRKSRFELCPPADRDWELDDDSRLLVVTSSS